MNDADKRKIEQLQHLFDEGVLTKEEFEQKKMMVLSDASNKQLEKYYQQLDNLHKDGVLTSEELEKKKINLKNKSNTSHELLSDNKTINTQNISGENENKYYSFSELHKTIQTIEDKNRKKRITKNIIIRVLAAVFLIVIFGSALYEPKVEPIEYTSSAALGATVYVSLTSIEPLYGTYRENGNVGEDYTDVVCKCYTSKDEKVWVAIPYSVYVEKFDSSAKDSVLNRGNEIIAPLIGADMPKKLEYSSPKKIYAMVVSSETVAKDLEKNIGERVLEYEEYTD